MNVLETEENLPLNCNEFQSNLQIFKNVRGISFHKGFFWKISISRILWEPKTSQSMQFQKLYGMRDFQLLNHVIGIKKKLFDKSFNILNC